MKKFYVVTAMMATLLMAGCGQGDKQESEPAKVEAPVAVVEQAAEAIQSEATAVVEAAKEATEAAGYGAAQMVEGAKEAGAEMAAQAEGAVDKAAQALEQAIKTEAAAGIPATVVLETKMGKVTMPHQKHADTFDCATCHGEATPGPFELGKDKAHALCMGCHKEKAAANVPAGPTKCTGCHVK